MRPRAVVGLTVWLAVAAGGCAVSPREPDPAEPYLLIWAGDADRKHADFFAVVDARPGSRNYGKVLKTYPVRSRGNEPYGLQAFERPDRRVFATGLLSGRVFTLDLRDPLDAKLLRIDEPKAGRALTAPMGAASLPNGNVVVACADRLGYVGDPRELFGAPGGLVEVDAQGVFVRERSAAHESGRSFVVSPGAVAASTRVGKLLSTNAGHGFAATAAGPVTPGMSVQTWSLKDLGVESTLPLPAGARGEENLGPRAARFGNLKAVAFVSTHEGGALFASDAVTLKQPDFRLAFDYGKGSLPGDLAVTPDDHYVVQALTGRHQVVSIDVRDPRKAKPVSSLRFDQDPAEPGKRRPGGPGGLAMASEGVRIAVADYTIDVPGARLDGDHRVYMVRLEPWTGRLRFDPNFQDETTGQVGIDFNRTKWPHGETGPARPRGLLFISPPPED